MIKPNMISSRQQKNSYDNNNIDSSCSSSDSGISSPSLPLHLQQQQRDRDASEDDGYCSPSSSHYSIDSPVYIKTSEAGALTTTPTPTTTIGSTRSPRTKQLHGKLNRPRRRGGHRSSGVANASNSNTNTNTNNQTTTASSFGSIASENSASEHSLLSRNSSILGLSRRGSVGGGNSSNNLHSQQYSSSPNSLFGLMGGSTYSTTAGIGSATTKSTTSTTTTQQQQQQQQEDSYEYYHKHHHHPQHYESTTPSPRHLASPSSVSSSSSQPPLPSIRVIASELTLICSLYCRYAIRSIRKPCKKFQRRFIYGLIILFAVILGLTVLLCWDFYNDAVDVCTPPPSSRPPPSDFAAFLAFAEQQRRGGGVIDSIDFKNNNNNINNNNNNIDIDYDDNSPRPLVEYYVHGRGIGHYARSVAIVEKLNRAGVDVRMFLTRASMWRALHEDAKIIIDPIDQDVIGIDQQLHREKEDAGGGANSRLQVMKRGKTTAISIASITPDQTFFDALSHVMERVSGDCEVSATSGRYPQLIVSDGDFPGMIRAELGGIPSVGIAHGELFNIAQKPSWVKDSNQLNRAWNKQGRLNYVSSLFTEWQIATHFCFLESRFASGTVARAPLRPEVLQMAESRKWFRRGKVHENNLPQSDRIKLLLTETSAEAAAAAVATTGSSSSLPSFSHRKLVICYFRDHNGEHVVQALLEADFDVLLFDTGYSKEMASNPNRYGIKWIVTDRDQERKKHIRSETDRRRLLQVEDILISPGDVVKTKTGDGPKLIRVMDRSLFVPLMHVADGVASSAGSQLMSECIYSHMPLLALYTEEDDEQRLNVELSHHIDAPCHRPLVFGNSFESLTYALKSNETLFETHHRRSPIFESLKGFVREVKSSSVSDTYYRNAHLFGDGTNKNETEQQSSFTKHDWNETEQNLDEEDPFRGLPDAAAIILEIVKQVVQKG